MNNIVNFNDCVLLEVMRAYADSHGHYTEEAMKRRNLQFKASSAVSRDEAIEIMGRAIDAGYNEFEANLLSFLPKETQVTIARENSVCIYISPPIEKPIKKMNADEWHTNGGVTRIWWD